MNFIVLESSEIYANGFKSFFDRSNIADLHYCGRLPDISKLDHLSVNYIDAIICDLVYLDDIGFVEFYNKLKLFNNSIILIPSINSVYELNYNILAKFDIRSFLIKSIDFKSFDQMLHFIKTNNLNFLVNDFLKQYSIESRISKRLLNKFKIANIRYKEDVFEISHYPMNPKKFNQLQPVFFETELTNIV